MTVAPKERRRSPAWFPPGTPDPRLGEGHSYQRSLILTRFTAAIFVASQERVAPRCGTPQAARDAAGDKKRPALRVGHTRLREARFGGRREVGPPGALRRLPDVPHRAARRACPGGPMCPMKRVNIKDRWYQRPMMPPSRSRAPAAYPGRTVFLPWRRTRRGSPERRGLGEIAGPCARPSCRRSRQVV